jgi:hypothetical protein
MNVAESLPLPIASPNADYSGFSDAKRTKRVPNKGIKSIIKRECFCVRETETDRQTVLNHFKFKQLWSVPA